MNDDAEFFDDVRFRRPVVKFEGVLWPFQAAAHFVGGVVIASDHRNANASFIEIGETGDEFEAAFVIAPIAVKNVPGN